MSVNLATLIPLALKVGIVLTVFALGLSASPQDATYLFRRPGQLCRALLAMNVVMPLFAAAMVAVFNLHTAVQVVLITLAVSPIPPILPKRALQAGGGASYTIGLLVAAALLAIVFVPLAVDLLGRAFGRPTSMSPAAVALVMAITVLAPLAAGLLVRRVALACAARIAQPLSLVALVLLVVSVLLILFTAMPAVVSLIGNGTLVAIVAFVLVGLAAGHLLGGPEPANRTTLALATSSRHPGMAVAIASANFPEQKLAVAAILLYLLVNVIVSMPYQTWCRRRHTTLVKAV
jgi:BASS family bile acid:Na+ symporter